ncbi:MAG: hypothetical protein HY075_08855 [Deltaproteobacteria bacterium]|nr:hypothetical protein [Deltaproteobacteria bacterium]
MRAQAWEWLEAYPLKNHNWSGYFEDIEIHRDPSENPNQYTPLETARYLLLHPELDAHWRAHVDDILAWVTATFAGDVVNAEGVPEKGVQFGAEVISEQRDDLDKMSSHTARFASVLALYAEKTGDAAARDRAFRSFNWAAYFCRDNGIVKTSVDEATGFWFSDGYGDYMRHFLRGMAAQPEWAPGREPHLLRSTSIVRKIGYEKGRVAYSTFDFAGVETLRMPQRPLRVRAGGKPLAQRLALDAEGYVVEPLLDDRGGFLVRVRHDRSGAVELTTREAPRPVRRGD